MNDTANNSIFVGYESTRRGWLATVGAGGAVALSTSLPVAAAQEQPPLSFAVVSDTHLGRQDKMTAQNQWKTVAEELAETDVKFVLHLGDIVDAGREAQYAPYKEIRDSIGKPVHEIPGNHDPAEAFAKKIRREVDTTVDHGWLTVVLMNNSRRTSHDGFFEEAQLDWLAKVCNEAADRGRKILICCHVPVVKNGPPDRAWYVKPEHGQKRFYEIVTAHKEDTIAVFHGHFHNGIRGWDAHAPLHEICFPSVTYNQNRGLEAKGAPGFNPVEFRPGYCLVTLGDGKLAIDYKPTGADVAATKSLATV